MREIYKCTIFEKDGKKSVIVRSAESEKELIRSFAESNQTLVAYKKLNRSHKKAGRIAKNTVITFTDNMMALLSSGLSVQNAISVCERITDKKSVSKLCASLSHSLSEGKSLHASLSLCGTFPNLYVSLVRIGELSGKVPFVFSRLSNYLNAKKELSRKMAASLIYPITVSGTALAVVLCMIFFVFPKLSAVFEVFSSSSPALESRMKSVQFSFSIIGSVFAIIIMLVLSCFLMRKLSEPFAEKVDRIILSFPFISKYIKISETNDFSFAMELLSSSGITIPLALEQAAEVSRNRAYRKAELSVMEDVKNGTDMSSAMKKHKEFPPYISTWLGIGEATGSVEQAFTQIRSYYEKELSTILSNLAAGAEPAFILVTGILIFILVGQFVLPVFSMLGEL